MRDGSDAIADWPILNALLNTACGATWVSVHHGGGVGIGYSIHAGMVVVADGTPDAAPAPRARPDGRSRDGRHAARRRRLPGGDRRGARAGSRPAVARAANPREPAVTGDGEPHPAGAARGRRRRRRSRSSSPTAGSRLRPRAGRDGRRRGSRAALVRRGRRARRPRPRLRRAARRRAIAAGRRRRDQPARRSSRRRGRRSEDAPAGSWIALDRPGRHRARLVGRRAGVARGAARSRRPRRVRWSATTVTLVVRGRSLGGHPQSGDRLRRARRFPRRGARFRRALDLGGGREGAGLGSGAAVRAEATAAALQDAAGRALVALRRHGGAPNPRPAVARRRPRRDRCPRRALPRRPGATAGPGRTRRSLVAVPRGRVGLARRPGVLASPPLWLFARRARRPSLRPRAASADRRETVRRCPARRGGLAALRLRRSSRRRSSRPPELGSRARRISGCAACACRGLDRSSWTRSLSPRRDPRRRRRGRGLAPALAVTAAAIAGGLAFVSPLSLASSRRSWWPPRSARSSSGRARSRSRAREDVFVGARLMAGAALLVDALAASTLSEHERAVQASGGAAAIHLPDPAHASADAVFAAERAVDRVRRVRPRPRSCRRRSRETRPLRPRLPDLEERRARERASDGQLLRGLRRRGPAAEQLLADPGAGVGRATRTGSGADRPIRRRRRAPHGRARRRRRAVGPRRRSRSRTGRTGTRCRRASRSTGGSSSGRRAPASRRRDVPARRARHLRPRRREARRGPDALLRAARAAAPGGPRRPRPPATSREELWGEIRPISDGYRLVAVPGPDFLGRLLTAALLHPGHRACSSASARSCSSGASRRRRRRAGAERSAAVATTFRGRLVALFVVGVMIPLLAVTFFLRSTILTRSAQDTLDHARTALDTARQVLDDYLPSASRRAGQPRGARRRAPRLARQRGRLRPLRLRARLDARRDVAARPLRGGARARPGPGAGLRRDRPVRRRPAGRVAARLRKPARGDHDGALASVPGRARRPEPGAPLAPPAAAAAGRARRRPRS